MPSDLENAARELLRQEDALRENVLPTSRVLALQQALRSALLKHFAGDDLLALRFRKWAQKTHWIEQRGSYPAKSEWPYCEDLLRFFAQSKTERTIKRRLKTENLSIETRFTGEGDFHILIAPRGGSGEKAHVIIDAQSAEIRVEDDRIEPTKLVRRLETILTLEDGSRIRTTREVIERLQPIEDDPA